MAKTTDSRYFRLFELKPRKGDLRRLEIVLAAVRIIASEGSDALTLDSVGKALGVRRSHIVYYFKLRDELIHAVMHLIIATGQDIVVETVRQARTPRQGIEKHIEGHYEWLQKYPEHGAVMLAFYYMCSYDEKACALNTVIREKGLARVVGMLEEFPKFKKLKKPAKQKIGEQYQNILTGNLVALFSYQSGKKISVAQSDTMDCLWTLLKPYT